MNLLDVLGKPVAGDFVSWGVLCIFTFGIVGVVLLVVVLVSIWNEKAEDARVKAREEASAKAWAKIRAKSRAKVEEDWAKAREEARVKARDAEGKAQNVRVKAAEAEAKRKEASVVSSIPLQERKTSMTIGEIDAKIYLLETFIKDREDFIERRRPGAYAASLAGSDLGIKQLSESHIKIGEWRHEIYELKKLRSSASN